MLNKKMKTCEVNSHKNLVALSFNDVTFSLLRRLLAKIGKLLSRSMVVAQGNVVWAVQD